MEVKKNMNTEELLKQIYQDLKESLLRKDDRIFVTEYRIPSINYSENENTEDLYFVSGIKMELDRMMEQLDFEVYYSSYKDKYFFSNKESIVQAKQLQEIEMENKKEVMIKQEFIEKIEQEYATLKQVLEQKTPKEIIAKAYELVVKEQIKDELKYRNYDKSELKALLKRKDILEEFYQDWRNADGRLGEILENTIDDTINIIRDNYTKEKRQKMKESR